MPQPNYAANIFRRPDTGKYYSIVKGIAREFDEPGQQQAAQLAPNAPVQAYGVGTTGYTQQHGGGTTGGTWSFANFQNTADSYLAASQPGDPTVQITPFTNPNEIKSEFKAAAVPSPAASGFSQEYLNSLPPDVRNKLGGVPTVGAATNLNYSSTITPSSLQKASNLNLPTATPGLDQTGAFVAGANTGISEIMKNLAPPATAAEQKQQTLLDQMASLVEDQGKRASEQLTAEQSAGLPQLRQQFADINAQILTKNAEYEALIKANENRPATMQSIIGSERAILNAKAADIGLLMARAQGLQGQVQMAQETVDRAIGLKYQTINDRLNTYEAQLNALIPTLNKEERARAAQQQALVDEQKQALAEVKAEEKQIQGLMLDAATSGAPSSVLAAISGAKSLDQAAKAYSGFVAQNQPDPNIVALQSKFPDAGITTKDTFSQAQAKLKGSRIYQDQVRGPVSTSARSVNLGLNTPTPNLAQAQLPTFEEYLAQKENEAGQSFTQTRRSQIRAEYDALKKKTAQNDPQELVDLANIKASAITEKNKREFFLDQVENFLKRGQVDKAREVIASTGKSLSAPIADDLTQARLAKENINRISQLVENLGSQGPIIGQVRKRNPYDDNAVELQNLITQTVPGLARGIFKEVGVLTDQEISRYRQTIASESLTLDQARTATKNLLDTINLSIELQLDTLNRSGFDVSKFEDIRDEVKLPELDFTPADEDYIKSLGIK